MGVRRKFNDFRNWCPQPPRRLPTKLKRYSMPITAMLTVTIIFTVSFLVFSSSLISFPSAPIVSLVNVPSSTTPMLLWNYTTGGRVSSSPVVDDGIVYAGSSNANVYALNATNGAQLRNYTNIDNASGYEVSNYDNFSPAVINGVIYLPGGVTVNALNAANGAQLWSDAPFINLEVYFTSPIVADGVVYVSTTQSAGFLFAFNAKTGNELWSKSITPSEFWSSPAVVNGVVYVGTDEYTLNPNNGVYALNAKNGGQLWNYSSGFSVGASPVVVGRVVYFVTYEGTIYALNAQNGIQLWNYTTGGPGPVYSSPAVANGVVYAGSDDGNVYALNATSGVKLWSSTAGNGTLSSPAVVSGVVYLGSSDGNIYALGAASGAKLWSYATSGAVGSPVIVNGALYVGGGDNVYALRVSPSSSTSSKPSNTLPFAIGAVVVVIVVAVVFLVFLRKLKTKPTNPA